MTFIAVRCPHCQSDQIVKRGRTARGTQRYLCQNTQGFKCFKRGGWQWQYTQMHAPERVARLWLALAVATLWMVSVGGALEVERGPTDSDVPDLRALLGTTVTTPGRQRRLRLMRLGWLWCLVCQITA